MNKVLHVCHSISFGGISTFVKSLVKMNSIFQKTLHTGMERIIQW